MPGGLTKLFKHLADLCREVKGLESHGVGIGGATGLAPEGWDTGTLGRWNPGKLGSLVSSTPPALPSRGRFPDSQVPRALTLSPLRRRDAPERLGS
jgi:hypothetical protein